MTELIFKADPSVWDPHLGGRILGHIDAGRVVIWRSVSGAALTLANVQTDGGGDLVGIRWNRHDPFATDGLPLVLGRIEATSCGLWSPTGYRSSRPVTVHVFETAHDVGDWVGEDWKQTLLAVADQDEPHAWLRQVPDGHPVAPCPVAHCPVNLLAPELQS